MSNSDVIRAWKDPRYRRTFSESELANLPEHPAGAIELIDADLESFDITQGTCTRLISEPCNNC